jgi:exonuclease 3'-5' domain-containing protein 1
LVLHRPKYVVPQSSLRWLPFFVDTMDLVHHLVKQIEDAVRKPFIFVDLEGISLSRDGVIAIMQILVPPSPMVHLVDICTSQNDAFDVSAGPGGQTLRTILEPKGYPKVFFDVRNDSDALFSHFQISLLGVIDLQLLEFASRPVQGRFVMGLAKCILEDGGLARDKSQAWQSTKEAGKYLFASEKG